MTLLHALFDVFASETTTRRCALCREPFIIRSDAKREAPHGTECCTETCREAFERAKRARDRKD